MLIIIALITARGAESERAGAIHTHVARSLQHYTSHIYTHTHTHVEGTSATVIGISGGTRVRLIREADPGGEDTRETRNELSRARERPAGSSSNSLRLIVTAQDVAASL